jgi:Raf kinase inhibitor-like YbhB/YbcL family protein
MEVISSVFRSGSTIPPQYSCQGQNVNPPFNIFNLPTRTQGLVLIMHDPDAPSGDYLHWLVWDIPPSTENISVNSVPIGSVQGTNSAGQIGYTGPCPPAGQTHHYIFDFYALDTTLNLKTGAGLEDVKSAMKGHILERSSLVGTFKK